MKHSAFQHTKKTIEIHVSTKSVMNVQKNGDKYEKNTNSEPNERQERLYIAYS